MPGAQTQPRAKKRYPIVYTGPTSTTNTYSAIASTFTIIFDDSVTEELDFTKDNVSSVVETRAEERYSAKTIPQRPHGAEVSPRPRSSVTYPTGSSNDEHAEGTAPRY